MASGANVLGPFGRLRALFAEEIGRGTAVNLGFAVANSVVAVVTSIFAGNALGPTGIGVLSLGFLVLEFTGMIDNVPSAGFMRDYAAGEDRVKLATFLRLKIVLALTGAIVLALAAWPLASFLDVPVALLLFFAVIPATAILSSVATTLHEARRHPWRRSTSGFVEGTVKLVIYAAFWALYGAGGEDLVLLYAGGAVVASAVGAAVGLFLVPSLRISPYDRDRARRYVVFGAKAQATGVLVKVIFWGDILLIDIYLGHYAQGLYRTAYSVMAFVPLFAGTVGTFLFPAISEAAHNNDLRRVRSLFAKSFEYVLLIAVPLVILAVLFATPALRVFGPEFVEASWILQWLAAISLIPAILVPFEALFPAMDRPDLGVWMAGTMMVVNVGLDFALIPIFGIAGAIIATAVAFVVGLIFALAATRHLGILRPEARA